ncbi:YlaH-like family protein [Brevibacillus ruminantium]|uniref:YlaH-like family protein n=1 Tax=Brevibacillus ruminantium TaxID=2950604 RepID=A0ABY4WKE9_9BACL|nr:YlaH-like family protein [Brevibacillus ruminantium]USG67518.1 YlaH-like family protein [Brevibacillus ruminantium]
MEWFDLVSTYSPSGAGEPSLYDSFRMWADHYRAWIIFVQLILVYYLGFATRIRMPILKNVLLYILLFAGALIFAILDVQLPVKSALLIAIAILVIVKVRIKPDGSTRK